jgi:hypothetical protein
MIKVWTDAAEAGLLDRHGERGSTFAYVSDTAAARAVSQEAGPGPSSASLGASPRYRNMRPSREVADRP